MNDFYHEAGHVVMAFLFKDIFQIDFVTLDIKKSKEYDNLSLGGLKGKIKKDVKSLTPVEHDSIILILFAGFCADNIFKLEPLTDEFYDPTCWSPKLGDIRYSGDIKKMNDYLILLLPNLRLKQPSYFSNCIKSLHLLFQNKQVWDAITLISETLYSKENNTLTSQEIDEIIKSSELPDWWKKNKDSFLDERLKLIKTSSNKISQKKKLTWWERILNSF
ncbi:hypothetical protein GGR22_000704 [Flavobacterium gossypii]|uniref:Peptidase M41 domain-containing protein n=1 Tax=Flavobacterium gossypii TaxID=1646119 RepID=A0ABR6DMA8_9FLAO|nr:hypothetical protein [Flavobacterium gossypii]MBA9072578.1 hypothetical protein [Flavobacterium gossypii]